MEKLEVTEDKRNSTPKDVHLDYFSGTHGKRIDHYIPTNVQILNNGLSRKLFSQLSSHAQIIKLLRKDMKMITMFDNFISALVTTNSFKTFERT